jgi:hypothetical protein
MSTSQHVAEVVVKGQTDGVSQKLKQVADGTDRVKKSAEAAGAAHEKWGDKLDRIDSKMSGFAGNISKITGLLGAGGLVGMAMGAGAALGSLGERSQQVTLAHQALKISIEGARAATMGMVSTYDLTIAANKAVTLGVVKTDKEFAQLASTAAKLGAAVGQDAAKSVDDLTTALGRGSAEILDNLGVQLKVSDAHERYAQILGKVVSELTETEKKQAFMVVGLEKATEAADKANVSLDTHAAKLQAAGASWANFKDDMSVAATEAGGAVAQAFTGIGLMVADMSTGLATVVGRAEGSMFTFSQSVRMARMEVEQTTAALFAQADAMADTALAAEKLGEVYQLNDREKKAEARIKAEQESFLDEQAYQDMLYGPDLPPAKKKKGKAKPKQEQVLNVDRFMDASNQGMESTRDIADSIEIQKNVESMAREIELREDRIALVEYEQELAAMQVEGGLADADLQEDLARRKYDAEVELLDFQLEAANTRAEILDLETARRRRATQEQQRVMVAAQAAEAKALAQKRTAYERYGGAVGDVMGQVTMALIDSANGSEYAAAKALAAIATGIRNQMILTSLKEFALAVASAASFNYPGAAQHAAAGGLAAAAAVVAGGFGAGISAAIPAEPSLSSGGGGTGGFDGGSSGGARGSRSKEDDDGVPTSYYDGGLYSKRPDRMPQAASNQGSTTNNITVLGATTDQVALALRRVQEQGVRSLGRVR